MKYKAIEQMDPKTQSIYQSLIEGNDKRRIANDHKVTINQVMAIAKRYNVGQMKLPKPNSMEIKPIDTEVEEPQEIIMQETNNKNKKINDDQILEILHLCEDTDTPYIDIAIKYGISDSRVCQIATEYGIYRRDYMNPVGTRSGSRVLTQKEIKEIVELIKNKKATYSEISNKFYVSLFTIRGIAKEHGLTKSRNVVNHQEIIDLIKEGELTFKEISDTVGCSVYTVSELAKKYGLSRYNRCDYVRHNNDKKSDGGDDGNMSSRRKNKPAQKNNKLVRSEATKEVKTDEPKPSVIKEEEPKVVNNVSGKKMTMVCSKNTIVSCALVKDRHDMPCSDYIFDGPVPESLMFNYSKQEMMVKEFIEDKFKINEDGVSDKMLIVYITGMSCCSATVIKVCHNMGINLTLMHFNNRTGNYRAQVIWDEFTCDKQVPALFKNNFMKFDSIYTYNCTVNDVMNSDTFYTLTDVKYTGQDQDFVQDIVLCKNLGDVVEVYLQVIREFVTRDKRSVVYVAENKMTGNESFKHIRNIMSSDNNPN